MITNSEAEERGMEYDSDGITYLFDLDYHETENPMTVDATRFGNVSHFINHSVSYHHPNYVWLKGHFTF